MAFDNGRAGLEAIREMAPDLALVDRWLGDPRHCDRMRRGVSDYVPQPFEAKEIKSAVSRALNEPNEPQPISRQKLVILCPKLAA
jgi:DNA-binding NarL/FixJ family response regulator